MNKQDYVFSNYHQKGLTWRAIIEGAQDLFMTQGYNATSKRGIAQQAGIALGGIYTHFASKEEIFENVAPPELQQGAMGYYVDGFLYGVLESSNLSIGT